MHKNSLQTKDKKLPLMSEGELPELKTLCSFCLFISNHFYSAK